MFKKKNKKNEKKIFLTYCSMCGKRIAVETDKFIDMYTCNDCVAKDSVLRDGYNEAVETDLFDEYGVDERLKNDKYTQSWIKWKKERE